MPTLDVLSVGPRIRIQSALSPTIGSSYESNESLSTTVAKQPSRPENGPDHGRTPFASVPIWNIRTPSYIAEEAGEIVKTVITTKEL